MSRLSAPEGEAILISWISVNAGSAPLLSALDQPSPLYGRISRLYLLWRDAPGAPDREVLSKTRDELRHALDRFAPETVDRRWPTESAPTDHLQIRRFVEAQLKRIRADHPGAHLYVHLSPGTPAMHAVWLVLCATGFVAGPVTMIQGTPREKRDSRASPIEAVPIEVDTWLRRHRASRPVATSTDDDGGLWDPDAFTPHGAMRRAIDQLLSWASLPAPVLLLGERGTGKSTLANVLRAAGPFQRHEGGKVAERWPSAVCGQFRGDPQMARSELFGHERGAFTGASQARDGLLKQADGDSLFLDEIADLDRDTQRQLMHALEGRGFRPVGGTRTITSNFRLVCATNRPLAELRGGLLDHDLFDRLSTFTLTVPPLRACREDLGVFWGATLRRVMSRASVEPARWTPLVEHTSLVARLRASPLPGNLRDLQRVAWHLAAALRNDLPLDDAVERAVDALGSEATAGADALPSLDELRAQLPLDHPLPSRLDALRARWIEAALAEGGNRSRAAELLGVKRETLNSWIRSGGGPSAPEGGENEPVADNSRRTGGRMKGFLRE